MYKIMDKEPSFADWLKTELKNRDWNQSTLARRSGLSRSTISNYINRTIINPDKYAIEAIAHAFGYPPEVVYRATSDYEIPQPPRRIAEEIAAYKLTELTDKQLDEVLQYIEFIQDKDERMLKQKNREGSSPPEMVKRQT